MAWNGFKDVVEDIEKQSRLLHSEDSTLEKSVIAEHTEYKKRAEEIDSQYLTAKKERQTAQDDLKRVCNFYFS